MSPQLQLHAFTVLFSFSILYFNLIVVFIRIHLWNIERLREPRRGRVNQMCTQLKRVLVLKFFWWWVLLLHCKICRFRRLLNSVVFTFCFSFFVFLCTLYWVIFFFGFCCFCLHFSFIQKISFIIDAHLHAETVSIIPKLTKHLYRFSNLTAVENERELICLFAVCRKKQCKNTYDVVFSKKK